MKVYCAHAQKVFARASNYYKCGTCLFGWYSNEPIPLVIIGETDPIDVNPKYFEEHEVKDLSKKKFTRCRICKDLLEKRKHYICQFKDYFKDARAQHADFVKNIMIVIRGFKSDK